MLPSKPGNLRDDREFVYRFETSKYSKGPSSTPPSSYDHDDCTVNIFEFYSDSIHSPDTELITDIIMS